MKRKLLSLFLVAVMMLSSVMMSIPANAASVNYSDVSEDMWSYDDIVYVTENGLMNGTGGSSFSPAMSLTRGMVVTVLWRMEGSPRTNFQDLFCDVDVRQYYSEAVIWAKNKSIVTSTGSDGWEETFSPNREITRQELATMFVRFATYKNIITDNTASLDKFTDKDDVADWASDAMKWATSVGLINGTGNGDTLSPTGKATREQFAAIMHRYATADFDYNLVYSDPMPLSQYTEQPYPLVNDADLYVAVDGNDNNPGTLDKPLATFEAAKAKVRDLKKTAKDEIVVAFKAGYYGELNNITFTEDDAGTEAVPIKYCKYGDGDVIFCNGVYIEESEFTPVEGEEAELFNPDIRENVYKADLTGKVNTFDPFMTFVFSESGLMTEAREPDGGYYMNMTTTYNERESIQLQMKLPGLVESYSSLNGLKINGYLRCGWIQDSFEVKDYDTETKVMTLDIENSKSGYYLLYPIDMFPLMFEGRTDDKVYFSNLPEFVDSNGEYCFVTETSTLYVYRAKGDYWINEGVSFATLEKGADYISFVGFDFNTTSDNGIVVYSDHFTFDIGKIYNIGGTSAIYAPNPVKYLRVTNSEMFNCVDTCVWIGTWDGNEIDPEVSNHNVIDNNYFHDFTLPTYFSNAVNVSYDVGTVISHNIFYEGSRTAISYSWCSGLRIEYNVFDTISNKADDCGAVSTGAADEAHSDNIIRYNIFKNLGYGDLAIYIDCEASHQEVSYNIIHNGGVAQNGGTDNIFTGNVFIGFDSGIGSTGRDTPPTTYMDGNIKVSRDGDEWNFTKLGTVGENNVLYSITENTLFVNPTIGDYSFLDGKGFYDIPYEMIGRY
ncbi:MAG: S-layer homology domain-containing protein [Clostridia bacterium]|nr:S-layer homology domain-containing protein [Clostridia bacterium]